MALLPKPKGEDKAVAAPKKSASTRSMVPYTLSKRYQDSKSKSLKAKAAALRKAKKLGSAEGDESDSDDDDEPVSFFSHLDEPRLTSDPTPSNITAVSDISQSNSWADSTSQSSHTSNTMQSHSSGVKVTDTSSTHRPAANSAPLAPKPFKIAHPNYDPITGIYSYGSSEDNPAPAVSKGWGTSSDSHTIDSDHSTTQVQPGGWEQYYHQAEQELVASNTEYYETPSEENPSECHGLAKPMPGAGPGLSIDDDVVSAWRSTCRDWSTRRT